MEKPKEISLDELKRNIASYERMRDTAWREQAESSHQSFGIRGYEEPSSRMPSHSSGGDISYYDRKITQLTSELRAREQAERRK
jgi:hypothetical protein